MFLATVGCSREELMAMLVDKQEEVRDSSICDNSGLLGCSRAKLMAVLVDKREEVSKRNVLLQQ